MNRNGRVWTIISSSHRIPNLKEIKSLGVDVTTSVQAHGQHNPWLQGHAAVQGHAARLKGHMTLQRHVSHATALMYYAGFWEIHNENCMRGVTTDDIFDDGSLSFAGVILSRTCRAQDMGG